jgi:hypothetical protein
MVQQRVGLASAPDRHHQRSGDELCCYLRAHRPDDASREQIDDDSVIKPALRCPEVSEADATKVRSSTLAATAATCRSPRSGGSRRRPRLGFKRLQPHQSIQAARYSVRQKVFPRPPGSIDSIAGDKARPHLGAKAPRRYGCAGSAGASSKHNTHPARHRAPRTSIPRPRSPCASQ